ncbi:MAG TPA: 1,4-alpha-glucan branching protein GlgB [Candidatus Eisenbergiella merdigallinarum]|uniref:1,4-alpha-glucan branching enzyme GlgB n=1 Tax=Candidatus Eisenbergiella merdigallinarum TaxID=2838552 RepID=A0A9D2MU32_9FIRM|nr:1,4-alpha-glucan branching protein GlgB [Candidatus Eisenbergiella merdigallinarum]
MAKTAKKPETVFISEADQYLFAQGTHYDIYKKLGAHLSEENGKKGVTFAVWAPHAQSVHVVGSFNGWDESAHPMEKLGPGGIYMTFVPGIGAGEMYKFLITAKDGRKLYKSDPFANYAELRPGTASVIADLSKIRWSDGKWMEERDQKDMTKEPLAIYECHIGSWMKHPDSEDGFYNYREFADRIVEYLKELKYTHVELMGIAEHPFDGSWGYQVTGYYAPTSRYGTPEDFAYLVNTLHRNKIGVILDWVPAHFPRDAHGLADFDGEALFEHPDSRLGEHPDWGTKIFNYGKTEVKNFLIANALFWIKEFHVDGLRVDAVASMLYLDYGKQDGQWVANKYGGNENLEAIEFFKHFNSVIRGTFPGVMTIAEESTAWPKVTGPIEEGGLHFSFKWNMGWMHDFCEYMKLDPYFRKNAHYGMTFAMTYNSAENYILPLSHDEVVHLKCSMVNKMPGYHVDKYANLRLGYTYMFGHCGKKLLFMGQEFGQEREWSEARELDWFLLENDLNRGMQEYMKELLNLYHKYPCLYEIDNDWGGFEWVNADDAERSTYSFIRKSSDGKKNLLFVLNMTPVAREDYCVGVPKRKKYRTVLCSTQERFGGSGETVPAELMAKASPSDNRPYRITFDLPAYAAVVFTF